MIRFYTFSEERNDATFHDRQLNGEVNGVGWIRGKLAPDHC